MTEAERTINRVAIDAQTFSARKVDAQKVDHKKKRKI